VYVQFPSATGVQRDTPVRFCGYQVGRVTNVVAPQVRADLATGKEYHQTLVVMSIHKRYGDIPSNVEVKLMTRGLGSSYIELAVDPESLPAPPLDPNRPGTRYLVAGLLLQGSTGMTSEFFPADSQKKLDELIDGLKTLIAKRQRRLSGIPENKQNTKNILANLSEGDQAGNSDAGGIPGVCQGGHVGSAGGRREDRQGGCGLGGYGTGDSGLCRCRDRDLEELRREGRKGW